MENAQTNTVVTSAPPRRRPLFLFGVLLFILGPAIYAVQLSVYRNLTMPWYLPIMSTFGVLLMAVSVMQRGGILRIIGLLFFTLFCGFEWFGLFVGPATPPYAGPAKQGNKVPAFTTALASGKEFADKDLQDGNRTVLLFFRGRW